MKVCPTENDTTMMEHFEGRIGAIVPLVLSGEIAAISVSGVVPFEFRLLRNHEVAQLPVAIERLAGWQTFDPANVERNCYTTLYPCEGGTMGLDASGLEIETRGLFSGLRFVVFVWKRE